MVFEEYGLGVILVSATAIIALALIIRRFKVPAWLTRQEEREPAPILDQLALSPMVNADALFSIHVAIHNTPSEQVIATLETLRAMEYRQFEVIVVDYNTPDRATWLPVMAYCQDYRRFRFYHLGPVEGGKAEALNLALTLMNPDADHIAIIG